MKTNLLSMLLGAIVMFLIMQFVVKEPATQSAAEPHSSASVATQPNENVTAEIETASVMPAERLNEMPADSSQFQNNNPGESNNKIQTFIAASEVQKLKNDVTGLFANNAIKLDQLAELASIKIHKDFQLNSKSGGSLPSQQEMELINSDDSELTTDQLTRKQAIFAELEKIADMREKNRIEYEDAVKNLLTSSELEKYQQQELKQAKEGFAKRSNVFTVSMKVVITDLSDYQLSEIDRITLQHNQKQWGSVPIGSTLGHSMTGGLAQNSQALRDYNSEIFAVLSPEQIKTYRLSPIVFSP